MNISKELFNFLYHYVYSQIQAGYGADLLGDLLELITKKYDKYINENIDIEDKDFLKKLSKKINK